MPYIESPGFWGSLAQGIDRGWQIGRDLNERDYQRKHQEEQDNFIRTMQQIGVLMQQREQGGEVDQELGNLGDKVGMNLRNLSATPMQRQSRILRMPEKGTSINVSAATGIPQGDIKIRGREDVTDDELRVAGLPTRAQRATEGFEGARATSGTNYLAGKPTTRAERSVLGVKSEDQLKLEETGNQLEFVNKQAPNYAKEWIATHGQRIEPKNVPNAVNEAYGAFRERYGNDVIPPDIDTDARAAFGAAFYDALQAQSEMDLRASEVAIQRLRAAKDVGSDELERVKALQAHATALRLSMETTYRDRMQLYMQMLTSGSDRAVPPDQQLDYQKFVRDYQKANAAQAAVGLANRGLWKDPRVQELIDFSMSGVEDPATVGQKPGGGAGATFETDRQGRTFVSPQEKLELQRQGLWDDRKFIINPRFK